ncbi:hypothetical protein FB451DRAFT_1189912 [Mycena latifolia]|nr:hypothetical protein FB451DRAFT_1189912 [Mycena latifolia]
MPPADSVPTSLPGANAALRSRDGARGQLAELAAENARLREDVAVGQRLQEIQRRQLETECSAFDGRAKALQSISRGAAEPQSEGDGGAAAADSEGHEGACGALGTRKRKVVVDSDSSDHEYSTAAGIDHRSYPIVCTARSVKFKKNRSTAGSTIHLVASYVPPRERTPTFDSLGAPSTSDMCTRGYYSLHPLYYAASAYSAQNIWHSHQVFRQDGYGIAWKPSRQDISARLPIIFIWYVCAVADLNPVTPEGCIQTRIYVQGISTMTEIHTEHRQCAHRLREGSASRSPSVSQYSAYDADFDADSKDDCELEDEDEECERRAGEGWGRTPFAMYDCNALVLRRGLYSRIAWRPHDPEPLVLFKGQQESRAHIPTATRAEGGMERLGSGGGRSASACASWPILQL